MKQVFTLPESVELELLKNVLEEAGIRCALRNEQLAQALPAIPFAVELWVENDDDLPRAQELCQVWLHPPSESTGTGGLRQMRATADGPVILAGGVEPNVSRQPNSGTKENLMKTLAGLLIDHREPVNAQNRLRDA